MKDQLGGLVIVIPARGVVAGKSRLTAALSAEARAALSERMLRRVICAALEADVATAVVVVSPDQATLDLAVSVDPAVYPLRQDVTMPGLNPALHQARRWAIHQGAAAMLILFGDLPLLAPGDVRALAWAEAPVVLAPDRHGEGTNAALVPLAGRKTGEGFRFQFGAQSLAAHLEEADRIGLRAATVVSPGTAFDLDTPEDWRSLLDQGVVEPVPTP
ncbi:MAG: 2-phospho-L-lactate guanylyltransferase [Thermomicrobiales bacterium]|jgi:2-phospho-L-lactate guanylyltransferase